AALDQRLRAHQLGRRDDARFHAEQLGLAGVLEPVLADRNGSIPRREDDVEEMLARMNLGDPALVLDPDLMAETLEVGENPRVVAGTAEQVEILGGAPDARIGAHRIGAGHQEWNLLGAQLAQRRGVERLRLRGWRYRCGRCCEAIGPPGHSDLMVTELRLSENRSGA